MHDAIRRIAAAVHADCIVGRRRRSSRAAADIDRCVDWAALAQSHLRLPVGKVSRLPDDQLDVPLDVTLERLTVTLPTYRLEQSALAQALTVTGAAPQDVVG